MERPRTIVDKIKEKNIKQKPKWHFTIKNILNWIFYAICVLIGAASFSVILFTIQQTEFNLISHISHSRVELFLGLLPFFWIITLLIFLLGAIIFFKRSEKGYKYNWPRLIGYSTIASVLLGTIFFIGGGGLELEKIFSEGVSYYEGIHEKKKKIWMNPKEGFLSGTIENISGDRFRLIDFNNQEWNIDYSNSLISHNVILQKGEQIKLIGEITGSNNFYVREIRSWNGNRQHKKRQNRGRGKYNKR